MRPSLKLISAFVLIATLVVGTYGGFAYYQQIITRQNDRTANLASQLTNSTTKISSLSSEVSLLQTLDSQLTNQNSQLAWQIQQLQSQIVELHQQVVNLTQTHQTIHVIQVSSGTITLTGFPQTCYTYHEMCRIGGVAFINFTVPYGVSSALVNVSYSAYSSDGSCRSVCPRLALLNIDQYEAFISCNCLDTGNITGLSATWSTPFSPSYAAQVQIPRSGPWIVAFQLSPGQSAPLPYGTWFGINEEVKLILVGGAPTTKTIPPTLHTQLYQQNLSYQFSGGAQNQNPLLTLHFNFTGHDPGSDSLDVSIYFSGSGNTPPLACQTQGQVDCGAVYLLNSTGGPSPSSIVFTSICTISANCGTIHYSPVTTPVMYVYLAVSVNGSGTVIVAGRHTWTVTTIT